MVRRTKMKAVVLAAMLGISAAFAPVAAQAAGLGKISVMSSLGQPLKAEIDLTAVTREEAATIAAKLASPDAFKQANVDFNAALIGLKFAINKRPDGAFYITVTSTQPINDPFVDMLVELNWATGRLVREYTFLLDPSDITPKPVRLAEAPTSVTPPVAAAPVAPAVTSPTQARAPEGTSLPKPSEPAPKRGDSKAAPKAAQKSPAAGSTVVATSGSVEVKRGDTLGKIARENLPGGVSLDQMMIALQRANPGAFINDNINLLKTGVVLNMPDQTGAGSISSGDARRLVVAQTADFKDYQAKLAGTAAATPAAKATAPTQAASGKVTAKVEDKAKPKADTKDQLKLSKADVGVKGGPASKGVKAAEEEVIAKDRAVKDAQGRVSQLEKNVQDLQKLLEVKNQELAKQQAASGSAAVAAKAAADKAAADKASAEKAKADAKAAADKAVADKASADKAKADADAKAKADKAASDKAAADAKVAADKAAQDAKAAADKAASDKAGADKAASDKASADKAASDKAAADKISADKAASDKAAADKAAADDKAKADAGKAPPVAEAKKDEPKKLEPKKDEPKKAAAPPPEKSLLDEFTDNPLYLGLAGALGLGVVGYGIFAVRRKRKYEKFENSVITGGDLKANSVFGNTGGQSIDTGNSSFQSDFSQIGTSQINADEVDPVAEADVYMAYGRDQQAEEILKEALSKDPNRQTVRMKLLDIYSARGDRKSFEANASELYATTGGTGDAWTQVRSQGQAMDPTNPLYGGQVETTSATIPLAATAGAALAAGGAAMFAGDSSEKTVVLPALGGGDGGLFANDPMTKTIALDAVKPSAVQAIDLDFDLDLTRTSDNADIVVLDQIATSETSSTAGSGLDFDLGFGDPAPVAAPVGAVAPLLEMPVAASPAVVPPTDFAPGGTLIIDAPVLDDADATVAYRPKPASAPAPSVAVQDVPSVDFDLGGSSGTLEMPQAKVESIEGFTKTVQLPSGAPEKAPAMMEAPAVDFEFDLGVGGATVVMPAMAASAAASKPAAMPPGNLDMELSTISLDLNKANQVAQNTLWQEIATKLDLAKAYEEMGDKDGARELLHEVLKEGDAKQKDAANKMLATL